MNIGRGWRRLFRIAGTKKSIERNVDEELEFHLAMRAEKLHGQGVPPDEAQIRARERFGDANRIREELVDIDQRYAREVRVTEWIESVWADFKYAFRTLRRMPLFTTVATITLALGIGATTAMFTLVNGILLRPLPYPDADRLVRVIHSFPEKGLPTWGLSQPAVALHRNRATDFEAFTAFRNGTVTVRRGGVAERMSVLLVTSDFFKVVGIRPAMGRPFTADEDKPGQNQFLVLSHGTWQTRFGGDSSILGTTMDVNGQPWRIIGVMPPGFAFPRPDVQAWVPMGLDPLRRGQFFNAGLGRLKPGVNIEHAEVQTTSIMWDWARSENQAPGARDPSTTTMKTIVRPLQEALTSRSAQPLTVLFAAVSLVLLIAIANVATLLSSRAAGRQREIRLRTALGATGARVVRQLLTESLALATLGAVLGAVIAVGGVRLFMSSSLASLPRIDEVGVDARVLAFTVAISIASGLLFGLLPAIHGARLRLASDLTSGQRESSHRGARRVNSALVVAQLSLSVVLLIAAGLVLKSFQKLTSLDFGFSTDGVTSVVMDMPQRITTSANAMQAFVNTSLERVRAIPGVEAAALATSLPFEGNANYDGFLVEGRAVPPSGNEDQTYQVGVSPGYFAMLGIPLLHGRDFTTSDDSASLRVAVVDATIADRYWKGAEALGRRIRVTGDTTWFTIVGVVGAIHDDDATLPPQPHFYVSIPQDGGNPLSLAVRTSGSTSAVVPGVRRAIAELEPSIPLDVIRSLDSVVDQTFSTRRLMRFLLGGFALLAIVLAAVGIYGVMSLHVANRSREFGIRLAIGAEPGALLRLVIGEGAVLAALGVGIGIVGALAATRWIQTLLFDVSSADPIVYGSLSLLLAGIAIGSCIVPARRAARSDPLMVLRGD